MFIRFLEPRALPAARADAGIFGAAYRIARDPHAEPWLRAAIRDELDWFCENLPVPGRFGVSTRRSRRPYAGVCWFRPEARSAISRAFGLAALLREAGAPIARIASAMPGEIVYRDAQQVVAIPKKSAPPRWRPN